MGDSEMWSIMGLGLATVFLCLFSLILMVRLLRSLLEWMERRQREKEKNQAPPTALPAHAGTDPGNDLIAVIAAAVSVASGLHPSAFRIASFEKSIINTPEWGRIDRIPHGGAFGPR